MKKQGNTTHSKFNNSSIAKSKNNEKVEISHNVCKGLLSKVINDLKVDINKQMNEVKKSIQNFDDKFNNLGKKFSKEVEIMKKKKKEYLRTEKLNKANISSVENTIKN
jgi:hypothetical protein